ncbi:hypothetical protein [Candidatus Paracaedibacter symbiosus]|uniref:hypothetical protein n=1 Tax=Candidatus Paracaedibacter symbiosus TaxID=244582 RepID=UPI0005096A5B|nr:hypothetical protein [Candidatus Paracaedibacter symbiosus]
MAFKSIMLAGITLGFTSSVASASLHDKGVYVGTSFGVSQLFGKRTDSISNNLFTLTLFPNKRMRDTSLEAALFAGYRYVPCHTNLVFSLEGSFAYGPYEQSVFRDLTPGFNGNQVAIFTRGIGYAITARAGYNGISGVTSSSLI